MAVLSAPEPLSAAHDVSDFSSGKEALDVWLRERALRAEGRSARTYVVRAGQSQIVGYYAFASGGVRIEDVPKTLRRNMPPIIPVTVLARLAVDRHHHGQGIGQGLLRDALSRALNASRIVCSAAVLVHAIDAEAIGFYARYGFVPFPDGSLTLFLPITTIARSI